MGKTYDPPIGAKPRPAQACGNNANNNPPTQQYVNEQCIERKKRDSTRTARQTDYRGAKAVRQYKRCTLDKTLETATLYRSLDNCVAISTSGQTDYLAANVKQYGVWDKALEKQMMEAVKAIKEANKKLNEVENAAAAFIISYDDTCNSDQKTSLKKYDAPIRQLLSDAKDCNRLIDQAGNDAVLMAGFRTFTNVGGLDAFAARLTAAAKKFKDDIDRNNGKILDDTKAAQTDYTDAIKVVSTRQYDWFGACVSHQAIDATLGFICTPKLPGDDMGDICDKVQGKNPDASDTYPNPGKDRDD